MTKDIIKKKLVLGCLLNQIQIGSHAFIPLGDLTNEI